MPYLDYNATTPVDKRVIQSMIPIFEKEFGNPSSQNHDTGKMANHIVKEARQAVAKIVGMASSDVIFTSGATEANNLVFYGLSINKGRQPLHILVGASEHKSVLEPCRILSEQGATVKKINVTSDGTLDIDSLKETLTHGSVDVVSVMAANSETGVIHPIKEVVQIAHAFNVLVHCDATQAIGKIPFDAKELDIDMVTFSSHKIYGPKGIGALVATRDARKQMRALLYGGGQENNMRSGTLNVPGIVGFGKACEIAQGERLQNSAIQEKLRDNFENKITQSISGVTIHGKTARRIPNTSSLRIAGVLADVMIVNARNIEISTGSACSSASLEPSHVLIAMGLDSDKANESIRVSIGRQTTQQDIDIAVDAIAKSTQFVRAKESEMKNVRQDVNY